MYYFLAAFLYLSIFGVDLSAQEAGDFAEVAEEGDWEEAPSADGAALAAPATDIMPVASEEYIPPPPSNVPQEDLSETQEIEEEPSFSDSDSPAEVLEVHSKSQQDMALGSSLPQAILPSQKGADQKRKDEKNKEKIIEVKKLLSETRAHKALQTASPANPEKATHILLPYKKRRSTE